MVAFNPRCISAGSLGVALSYTLTSSLHLAHRPFLSVGHWQLLRAMACNPYWRLTICQRMIDCVAHPAPNPPGRSLCSLNVLSDDEEQHAVAASSSCSGRKNILAGPTPQPANSADSKVNAVVCLTDDEADNTAVVSTSCGVKRKSGAVPAPPSMEQIRRQLNRVLSSSCRCSRKRRDGPNCFRKFRDKIDQLAALQFAWRKLHKEDMDREAIVSASSQRTKCYLASRQVLMLRWFLVL